MKAYFINSEGYSAPIDHYEYSFLNILAPTPIYDFRLHHVRPLSFFDYQGRTIKPKSRYLTDFGSIPRPVQAIITPNRISYLFHDSGYKSGGLSINGSFKELERKEIDDLLLEMLLVEGEAFAKSYAVWCAVRMFGWTRYKSSKVSVL